jgi:hypothetical protein
MITKYQATITFDFEVDTDECDAEVFVIDALPDLVEFDYTLNVSRDPR